MTKQLRANDGVQLHVAQLGDPEAEKTLVIVHGYGEHGGRYLERAKTFVDAGYRVLIPDVRGHGQSGGPRGYVTHFSQYHDDLMTVLRETADATDLHVLGHSHGALIVASLLLTHETTISRVALTSPFFGLEIQAPRWKLVGAKALSKFLPRVSLPTEIDPSFVSHDANVVAAYTTDPLNHHVANARWFMEAQATQAACLRNAGRLKVPTLVMQAGDDKIASPAATERWAQAAPPDLTTFEMIDGAYHELLFEIAGQQHADRVLNWFESGE